MRHVEQVCCSLSVPTTSGPNAVTAPVLQAPVSDEPESAEKAEMRRKVMDLRVLLLRIASRLRVNPRSSTVQQVMYRCACPRLPWQYNATGKE